MFKFRSFLHLLSMMLDDTRGGLDASSLHRTTSMDISLAKHILASLVSSRHFYFRNKKSRYKSFL